MIIRCVFSLTRQQVWIATGTTSWIRAGHVGFVVLYQKHRRDCSQSAFKSVSLCWCIMNRHIISYHFHERARNNEFYNDEYYILLRLHSHLHLGRKQLG